MAYRGKTISNPITGENITFLETTEETGGDRLRFDCRVTPGGAKLPPHVHTSQEERFTVKSGELGVMLGGEKYVLEAGARAVLPAGVKHQWWNAGEADVHFEVEAVPAGNLETVLEVVSAMAHAGKLNKKSMPRNPFLLAGIGRMGETYMPGIPVFMQRAMLAVACTIGRAIGSDPEFRRYRSDEVEAEAYEIEAAA